jgi:glycosyltransferase involved in cell wall biosynthesis
VPRYSIAIPTLARADTLEHTLATALGQTVVDFEVVVQNNGDDGATRAVVERLDDSRVNLFQTPTIVSMVENWELALSHCTGDLITFIGDDDGLLPDACEAAGLAIDLSGAEIVSWSPFLYLWPTYWQAARRNRLHAHVTFDFVLTRETSRSWLERFYAFRSDYSSLPMLYNSFVARSVVERVRDRYGKYFFGALPDVTSGIINAVETETFTKLSRSLSIAGISGHSYGNKLTRSETRLSSSELQLNFPKLMEHTEHGTDLDWLISLEMEVLNEQVIKEREPIHFDRRRLAWTMASNINASPSRYNETRALIKKLMQEYDIDPDELKVPSALAEPPAPPDGAHPVGLGEVFFVLDGSRFGVRTVLDAVGLAAQLVPPVGALVQGGALSRSKALRGLVRQVRGVVSRRRLFGGPR